MPIIITNNGLFICWISAGPRDKYLFLKSFVKDKICKIPYSEEIIDENIKFFILQLETKWKQCGYSKSKLIKKYSNWLSAEAIVISDPNNQPGTSRGRPEKEFHLLTEQMKKRKVAHLLSDYSEDELQYASELASRKNNHGSNINSQNCLSIQMALSLYLDLDLSEEKYNTLRNTVNVYHKNLFPSLYATQNFKKRLVPSIEASESTAEVRLQPLLRFTAKSVLELCKDATDKMTLICKWGMDGSSGHSRYKQKFSSEELSDEFLFFIAFAPIKLIDSASKEEIWVNSKPSSTLFCRPIKILLAKENRTLIVKENEVINKQISHLECDIFELTEKSVEVTYEMHCTMIDGSVANTLTETNSASRCFICNASPVEMNKTDLYKPPNINTYKYGLSTLHCWIRFFECLIHIAYRLPFKIWQVREENKDIFSENKIRIQRNFREKMGLLIDVVKQGSGTTNDGNTARKFFVNYEVSAEITGINKDLIYNFSLILRILSCGKKIKIDEFSKLLLDTRNLYLDLYPWYYMPSSVHKVLMHGCEVLKFFDLPIGNLSEEALASHKHIRYARLSHTRKSSRENTNRDLMTYLLISSDPFLSSQRKIKYRNKLYEEETYMLYYIETKRTEDT